MFQFPAFAFLTEWYVFNIPGCPIRKSADQRLFAPTRSLSQLITSFIASESLGIHHTPLLIYSLFYIFFSIFTHFPYIIYNKHVSHCGIYLSMFPVCQRTEVI